MSKPLDIWCAASSMGSIQKLGLYNTNFLFTVAVFFSNLNGVVGVYLNPFVTGCCWMVMESVKYVLALFHLFNLYFMSECSLWFFQLRFVLFISIDCIIIPFALGILEHQGLSFQNRIWNFDTSKSTFFTGFYICFVHCKG